jgi:ribosomal protein L21E
MAKRPRDLNQLAKLVVDIASGEVEDSVSDKMRHPSQRGRAGGIKGGAARAISLSVEQRSEIAKKAAATRWGQKDSD